MKAIGVLRNKIKLKMSFIVDFIKHIFGYDTTDLEKDENYLEDELFKLEILKHENDTQCDVEERPREVCFERTGTISYVSDDYVLINGNLYFEIDPFGFTFNVGDKVDYIAYNDKNDTVKVLKIVHNRGAVWGDDSGEEKILNIIEHVVIGEVASRNDRVVQIRDAALKFHLDEVETTLIPMPGDWLELSCTVKWDTDNFKEITADNVIKVLSVRPLRSVVKSAKVTYYSDQYGICDSYIYFDVRSSPYKFHLQLGSQVIVEAIESNQVGCTWRALSLLPDGNNEIQKKYNSNINNYVEDIAIEKNIKVTHPIVFNDINMNQTKSLTLSFVNNSLNTYIVKKWKIDGRKADSQIVVNPVITSGIKLGPNQNIDFIITCKPKFLGYSKELFILIFNDFEVKSWIEINVCDPRILIENIKQEEKSDYNNSYKLIQEMSLDKNRIFIPGVKTMKIAPFIPVRLPNFEMPTDVLKILSGNFSKQNVQHLDGSNTTAKILANLEARFPCLISRLNINNYVNRWHILLYMEEVEVRLRLKTYDKPNAFLNRCQDYLTLDVDGIAERSPSLIVGNRVIVKEIWETDKDNKTAYEGYIHVIKGNTLMMKFSPLFHEKYSGQTISIEFYNNRSVYRRCHQAINLAISHLGPDILFPRRVSVKPSQVSKEQIKSISWYNKDLNACQKTVVCNILLGVGRPMPYCIYGPPGTGKTVTVVETILQILSLIPHSRILVASPSNSAANLITERLINSKNELTGSLLRIISHTVLCSDKIPDIIRPYCATLDIAEEYSSRNQHSVFNDINVKCRKSFIGRHRITVGTCSCIGALVQMGFSKGHFTHIVVDEAGQASEPEIMIPLTFIDKEKGQIILTGDPMQLGPVIFSKYCASFGMCESYFSRILQSPLYQRDYESFKEHGYDERFVMQLVNNYRSLESVLTLPSSIFYNSTLIPMKNRNDPNVNTLLKTISDVFQSCKGDGGIYMYGIQGNNYKAEESQSWYNPQEALTVFMTVCKLYKKDVAPSDIGIIAPYKAQIKYLRKLFESTGADLPKIGTVEEFQGQEKPIILISTVRSRVGHIQIENDLKFFLGFIRNPNRVNVALTRGQVAAIIFGNPHLLCLDFLWYKIIHYVVENNCYIGCDLPALDK